MASRFAARSASRATSCHIAPGPVAERRDRRLRPRGAELACDSLPVMARPNSVASGVRDARRIARDPRATPRAPWERVADDRAPLREWSRHRRLRSSELTEHMRGDRGMRRRSDVERSSTHTGHHGASANRSRSSSAVAGRSATSARRMDPRGGRPSPSRRTCMNGGAVTYNERRLMSSTAKTVAAACTLGELLGTVERVLAGGSSWAERAGRCCDKHVGRSSDHGVNGPSSELGAHSSKPAAVGNSLQQQL